MTNSHWTRRAWIQTGLGCLGAASLGTLDAFAKTPTPVFGCRDAHLRDIGEQDTFSAMKKVGAQGIEVWINDTRDCPYLFAPGKTYSIQSKEAIADLANDFQKNGLAITAFALPNDFDTRPDFEIQWLQDTVSACKELGVSAIRIDVVQRKIKKRDAFLKFSIEMGKRLIDLVENTDIAFGIENHGGTTNDPAFLDPLFEGIGSRQMGLTLDTGNFYWFGHPLETLYSIYEKYADRTVHTHCKSIHYPADKQNIQRERGWEYGKYNCPITEGDIDFSRVAAILKKAGYKGDYCIENESLGKFPQAERGAILKKEIDLLKNIV
jgi:sugar phosphate isomerase/epimerase